MVQASIPIEVLGVFLELLKYTRSTKNTNFTTKLEHELENHNTDFHFNNFIYYLSFFYESQQSDVPVFSFHLVNKLQAGLKTHLYLSYLTKSIAFYCKIKRLYIVLL